MNNLSLLLEAVLNLDLNIQDALKSIRDDKTSDPTFAKLSELILNSLQKEFPKLKYDDVYLNPEKKEDFLLKGKIGKQETEQSVTRVINNVVTSIYDTDKNLPKYLIKQTGDNPNIPPVNTFLKEDEYLQAMSKFSKEELQANKEKRAQDKTKFIIDNLGGGAIMDEFSRVLSVKLSETKVVTTDIMKLVSGDEILKWYNSENAEFVKDTVLAKSCMKDAYKNSFMKIYSENPDKIQLLIKLNVDGKLVARALVWKLDYSQNGFDYYMDRCYYNEEEDQEIIFDWLRSQPGYQNSNRRVNPENMVVKLQKADFKNYPYADTFNYLFIESQIIGSGDSKEIKLLSNGFLSNLNFRRIKENDYLVKKLENIGIIIEDYSIRRSGESEPIVAQSYIDFDIQKTEGERTAISPYFQDFNIGKEYTVVTLKPSLGVEPSNNYLDELNNFLRINKKINEGAGIDTLFDVKIKVINEAHFKKIGSLWIDKNSVSVLKDTEYTKNIEILNGCRLFFYNVKNKLEIKEVADKLHPLEFSYYRYRNFDQKSVDYYVSALDLDILGILPHFKKMKPVYFTCGTAKELLEKNSDFIDKVSENVGDLLELRETFLNLKEY
jgi:hypothetical protein